MFALLAVLVVIFFDKPTVRVAKAAIDQPLITAGAGFLTAILTPMALIALTLTIILIPVTILTVLVLIVAWLFGLIAVGLEVGRRIAQLFNAEWAPAVSAGVGTFILFLVVGGLGEMVFCLGLLPQLLIGFWGLGAVIMTRFGTQDYAPVSAAAGTPVVEVDPESEAPAEEPLPEDDADSEEPADPQSDE